MVGRSASKALIANDNILANRVECYSLGDRFLVYLASGASLHSLQLFTMEIYDDVGGIGINSERYIESGAAIVGHDDEEGRVWLQMPRGMYASTIWANNSLFGVFASFSSLRKCASISMHSCVAATWHIVL